MSAIKGKCHNTPWEGKKNKCQAVQDSFVGITFSEGPAYWGIRWFLFSTGSVQLKQLMMRQRCPVLITSVFLISRPLVWFPRVNVNGSWGEKSSMFHGSQHHVGLVEQVAGGHDWFTTFCAKLQSPRWKYLKVSTFYAVLIYLILTNLFAFIVIHSSALCKAKAQCELKCSNIRGI